MSKNNTDEPLEVYSEFAKHLLKISNKNNLLHLSLTNINTGLYFEDVFNLEKLNKLGNSSNFSSIESIEKTLYESIKKKQYQLSVKNNYMLLTLLHPGKDLPELSIPLPYIETNICEEHERIIQKRDEELILSWINNSKPLKLGLLYKARRDGDSPLMFHKKVDGIRNTVTIIKTEDGLRFGGYVTKEWNTSGDFNKNDFDSFLFSLDSREKYMVNMEGSTNYNHPNYGPTFGKGFDLVIGENVSNFFSSDKNWSKFPNSYGDKSKRNLKNAVTGGFEQFLVKEIEVYEVLLVEDFDDDEDEEY
jgi:hypothetical protein